MLVNLNGILSKAYKEEYAVGAYNLSSLDFIKPILEQCQIDRCPVIIEVSESTVNKIGGYQTISNTVKGLIKELKISIPVVLHLDHSYSIDSCKKAIDQGFTSVMIDKSKSSLEENIKDVQEVVNYAHDNNVSVEAELGELDSLNEIETDIYEEFVSSTNIDALAPAIGNKHGIYEDEINLDFKLLGEISKKTKIPLVLHGASGLNENHIKTSIFCGVTKININTDIKQACYNVIKNNVINNVDSNALLSEIQKEIKKVIHSKNEMFGCINKGNL